MSSGRGHGLAAQKPISPARGNCFPRPPGNWTLSSGHGLSPVHPLQPCPCGEEAGPPVKQNVPWALQNVRPGVCSREFSSVLEHPNPVALPPASPRGEGGMLHNKCHLSAFLLTPVRLHRRGSYNANPCLKGSMRCIKTLSLSCTSPHPVSLQECLLLGTKIMIILLGKPSDTDSPARTLHCLRTNATQTANRAAKPLEWFESDAVTSLPIPPPAPSSTPSSLSRGRRAGDRNESGLVGTC